MEVSKDIIRYCLLYDFKMGLLAAVSSRRICQTFWDSAVNECTARHWFQKFKSRDLSLCDKIRSGRPHTWDDEALQVSIKENSNLICGEFATLLTFCDETDFICTS
ncbi:histone-lysine N-methyltransferase SETMAR [Nephila pilipes]|uniref:Histone-lysine N-methyltransferase SETMAR n=1 Tax=Nephila pilipes TaxID=299642 RepID=A0A8X6QMI3_NEPPI|nr:histone-lysine N-methyltransferase SETMAR [Nephila pilipes]